MCTFHKYISLHFLHLEYVKNRCCACKYLKAIKKYEENYLLTASYYLDGWEMYTMTSQHLFCRLEHIKNSTPEI